MLFSSALLAMVMATTTPNNCTDGIALARGVAAIANEYPWLSANKKDYVLRNYHRMYIIVPKKPDTNIKGGGMPTATVSKENCEVINVHLAR
ncbi:hypothetical protein MJO52_02010 [Microbulbifer variabilis]|uniref:Uncharacterized protein n=1 Tax=Microbulbifer variabilis TaxID=266805 RepID=A0ABY4VCB5_9GAMM|nr:hypothetical protein [Microbulbifer variabilis]USD21940.1 hypothetical protein MJO52_02010 [Microbulbifer variabilis]